MVKSRDRISTKPPQSPDRINRPVHLAAHHVFSHQRGRIVVTEVVVELLVDAVDVGLKALDDAKVGLAQRMHASGESARTIAATLGVSRATVYRVLTMPSD
ncbi:hypothetical protein Y900_030410 [Mycolicibacterium aromaticivorans JS19b1 = JCM 16368]|uniref:Resolvase HTH domain-containing protein n=1 Tax=Mycolicibacterium aromaticivorans JS19b1 = JCM 16368 TaxID=1440774 RepID=A0A064CB96_9MYCO|nr:hypothetical protein Y900_030410 [Mycolicibacterium aromaticivorans JS19b1 = JCM 16368]